MAVATTHNMNACARMCSIECVENVSVCVCARVSRPLALCGPQRTRAKTYFNCYFENARRETRVLVCLCVCVWIVCV